MYSIIKDKGRVEISKDFLFIRVDKHEFYIYPIATIKRLRFFVGDGAHPCLEVCTGDNDNEVDLFRLGSEYELTDWLGFMVSDSNSVLEKRLIDANK